MPTEETKIEQGKMFIKTKEDEEPKELKAIDISVAQNNEDDAIDAMKYGAKAMTDGQISMTIEIPKDRVRQIFKMHGLNRITRKRFIKLLMGCRLQKNDAEVVARTFQKNGIPYTPLGVQKVIETINMEAERGD